MALNKYTIWSSYEVISQIIKEVFGRYIRYIVWRVGAGEGGTRTYVVVTHWNYLCEVILMSIYNMLWCKIENYPNYYYSSHLSDLHIVTSWKQNGCLTHLIPDGVALKVLKLREKKNSKLWQKKEVLKLREEKNIWKKKQNKKKT